MSWTGLPMLCRGFRPRVKLPPVFCYTHGSMIREQLVRSFTHAALSPDPDLAIAALMIARVEYPKLDAGPYLDRLDAIAREAKRRVTAASIAPADTPDRKSTRLNSSH